MTTFGSLFAGIGGLDLGLERAGMTCKWQVENNEYATRVLERHWPDIRRWRDIKTFQPDESWSVDLICGGFPCQPVSQAGKRQGDADERWLWDEMRRVCEMVQPRWVLAENVPGLLSASSGRLFGTVVRDLASLGYCVEWDCIPAAAVGAPHLRYRVFILGHAGSSRAGDQPGADSRQAWQPALSSEPTALRQAHGSSGAGRADAASEDVADAQRCGPPAQQHRDTGAVEGTKRGEGSTGNQPSLPTSDSGADVADTASKSCDASNGSGSRQGRFQARGCSSVNRSSWSTEPNVGRVAHGVPARVDRLRALGNAVVPQVAEFIGRQIMENMDA